MKPPMPWMGGKQALAEILCTLFPLEFEKYVEVFGGGGALLFHKPPEIHTEIYNDINHLLVNLFRCIREQPEALIAELEYTLNSRLDFFYNRRVLKDDFTIPDVKMAAKYYQVVQQSYAAGVTSFGGSPRSMWSRFPAIRAASTRLQNVVIENKDFEALFAQQDQPGVLLYFDPPYYEAEDCYENAGFTSADHDRLHGLLAQAKGFILLSYNHCPQIVELYSRPGFMIYATSRLSNMAQRFEGGKQYGELIIGNYDLLLRDRECRQLSLFGDTQSIIDERNVIYNGIH